jgi:hypothetical protein
LVLVLVLVLVAGALVVLLQEGLLVANWCYW